MGNTFVLNTDHNPLVHLRDKKDPRGKFARWISELEEYNYEVKFIPGKSNVKADSLSRNRNSKKTRNPEDVWEDKIYSIEENDLFHNQLMTEQEIDPVIMRAKKQVSENKEVNNGQLRRVRKQLQIEKNVYLCQGFNPLLFLLTPLPFNFELGV